MRYTESESDVLVYSNEMDWNTENLPAGDFLSSQPNEMSAFRYLIVLLLFGVPFGGIIFLTSALGLIWLGLIFAGVMLLGLMAWRVEIGLLVMAGLIPWEIQTGFTEHFTLVKAVGIAVALIGMLHVFGSRGPRWPGMLKAAVAFGVWATFGAVVYINILSIISIVALLSNIIFLYLLVRFCSTRGALLALLWVVTLSSIGEAMLGVSTYLVSGVTPEATRLATVEEMNPNNYAKMLLPGIFLAPILITHAKSRILKLIMAVGICGGLIALLMSSARSSIAGTAVGAAVFLLTLRKVGLGTKFMVLIAGAIIVIAGLFFAGRFGAGTIWTQRGGTAGVTEGAQDRYWRGRIALEAGIKNPVLGLGMGNEGQIFMKKGFGRTESHNDIISSFAMTGVPGLIFFVGILILCWRGLWRLPGGILRSCLLGMWVAFFVTGFAHGNLITKMFWLAIGICAVAITYHDRFQKTSVYAEQNA